MPRRLSALSHSRQPLGPAMSGSSSGHALGSRGRDSLLSRPLAAGMPPTSPHGRVYGVLAREVVSPELLTGQASRRFPHRRMDRLPYL